jgi:hypothetical protein
MSETLHGIVTDVVLLDKNGNELRRLTPEELAWWNCWSCLSRGQGKAARAKEMAKIYAGGMAIMRSLDQGEAV